MNKRIVCVLLTLIMLVGMLPLSASAAGLSVSENAITVLKQMQNYSRTCTQHGTEWRNGYGTICTKTGDHTTHTIDESAANTALRTKLNELNAAVNASGLSLNQNQHDALVVLSYDLGTAWLSGTGELKTAVANKVTGNAMINAFGQTGTGSINRMVVANMYLNGAYSNVAPSSYTYVDYDANGGTMAEGSSGTYRQYFDASIYVTPAPVPTLKNKTFLGWYQGNTWVRKLAINQAGQTLVAKWQDEGATYSSAATTDTWIYANTLASGYIFAKPGDTTPVGTVTDTIAYTNADYIDAKGARWARLTNGKGWVLVSGTTTVTSPFDIDVVVTVTNSYVRSRVNADVASTQNGTYKQGDQLRIVSTANGSGFLWGQVADANGTAIGWVALMYTNWNEVKDKPTSSTVGGTDSTTNTTNAIAEAVINCQGYLNVRSEAGTDNAIIGALADGDHVDIYEMKFVNGHKWGRTVDGWILLTYAKVTMLTTELDASMAGDVLAYTYTGKLNTATTAHTEAAHTADTVGSQLSSGTVVAISMVKNDESGNVWGFNGTGWIELSKVTMDDAKYVVVAEAVIVRANPDSAANTLDKVVKGVELDISDIAVVDATIWGYSAKYNGWVNLASKYVQRSNAPIIENVTGSVATSPNTGMVGEVVNCDNLRVRVTGTVGSTQIGTLTKGTVVSVWEANNAGTWYKVDSNRNGTYDYENDGWVSASYLDVYYPEVDEDTSDAATGNGTTAAEVETGMGIVANTYTGVRVRQGAGTGYAQVGTLLTGTAVEILEVTSTATAKWGRTAQGWVCMDYVTMINKYAIGGTVTSTTPEEDPNAGQNTGGATSTTTGNTTTVSTPAIYAGKVTENGVQIMKTADEDAISIGTLNAGDNVTIQELVQNTTKTVNVQGDIVDGNATTTETVTYVTRNWARVNGGWVQEPEAVLSLDALDETTYTVTKDNVCAYTTAGGSSYCDLTKGMQVMVTELEIVDHKVWGKVEDLGNGCWVRLDQLVQGAITVKEETTNNNTSNNTTNNNTNNIVMGNGSNTGGYVANTTGYRYTGKVINANQVNVRSMPTTTSTATTQLKYGASLVIYETTINENMAWGRCDAGWIYLYYVDLTPVVNGALDARVVYNDNTIIYTDVNGSAVAGTYARMSVIDIYEIVGTMARTDKGWVSTNDLL